MLITGGCTPELEQALTEGQGLQQCLDNSNTEERRDRCRVTLLRLDDGVLEPYVSTPPQCVTSPQPRHDDGDGVLEPFVSTPPQSDVTADE